MEERNMNTSLEGVSLHVADVEKSVAFYSKLPGAQLILHRPGQFAKFKIGDGHVQVVAIPPEEKTFHIEMNAPDLQVLYAHLKAAGIEPDGPPTKRSFGRTNFRVHDPDGNILEFDAD
jgi:catechol 2,3-dioxygenase-like lactoylglutathione lyase family enzyme